MTNRNFSIVMVILGLLVAAPYSQAHQQKSAISTISFNPRTDSIEVMHRFRMHDAEHAVKQIFGKNADIIKSTKTKEQFSSYINNHFSMATDDTALSLTTIGYENDGQFFWVYQETTQTPAIDNLTVRHNALREIWPSQVNIINVEGKGKLQTMVFSDTTESLEVKF